MTCTKNYFCRVHGALDSDPKATGRAPIGGHHHRACLLALLAAFALAFLGFAFPATIDSHAAVAWSALWIVGYPLVSRAGVRHTLVWAIAAASLTPLALLTASTLSGAVLPSLGSVALHVAPVYAAAAVSVFVARYFERLQSDLSSAQRLGVYSLEAKIGQGGMGEVWRASHALLSRPAAIKLIKPTRLANGTEVVDARAKQRFENEAQITASLQSPHTVELYDFGATDTGTFYYVMELLDGLDLEQLVERDGPLEHERVVHILKQTLDSLAEAHERGLVHRDIKPANIVVSKRGLHEDFVKVLDFGLVQASEHAPGQGDGAVRGTPAYLAPEAITGEAPVDARADLYAVGCVAYWLLTGTTVFSAQTPTHMAIQHAVEAPQSPSERLGKALPWELEQLVLDCLAKDPKDRPQTAIELIERLARLDERAGSSAYPVYRGPTPRPPVSAVN